MKKRFYSPFDALTHILSGKWKFLILWKLNIHGFMRFNELQKATDSASSKVLSNQLKELENCKFIKRISYPVVPPKVEYHITDLGRSLWPVLLSMQEWSIEYLQGREYEVDREAIEELKRVRTQKIPD